MKHFLSFIFCALFVSGLLSGTRAFATDSAPIFTAGTPQSMTICENAAAISLGSYLSVLDSDAGQQEIWSVVINATHGGLVVNDTVISTGDTIVPAGLSYTPATGYSGMDSFKVQVTDGVDTVTTTIYVTINPLPSAGIITGAPNVCVGAMHDLADTTTGGAWSATNGFATVSSTGIVTGVAQGIDSVIYTVTSSCGDAADTFALTVKTIPSAGIISGIDSMCTGTVDTLTDPVAGGIWHSSNFVSVLISPAGYATGVAPGSSNITYIVSNDCGSDTARHTVKVQIPLPAGSILGPNIVCQFNTITLLALVPGGNWTSSNFLVAGVLGGLVLGITPGEATITYTLNNSCGTSTATQSITVLSTADCAAGIINVANTKTSGIDVFPNPANGAFTFNLSTDKDEPVQVVITNVTGAKIMEFTATTNTEKQVQLDVPAGMYFMNATTATGAYTAKLLISK